MFNRRDFLTRTLGGSSLLAVGGVVPEFLASTARAADAQKGKDTVLVVVELTGGNDGLNTVAPFADDLYHKARPTLGITKKEALKLDDHVGLHPRLTELKGLFDQKKLAVIQGVGYPNPDRSHFESMDIWQSADVKRIEKTGWLGRAAGAIDNTSGGVPIFHSGTGSPLAIAGAPNGGAVSVNEQAAFKLDLGADADRQKARRKLLEDVSAPQKVAGDDIASFVQKRQVQTLAAVETLRELVEGPDAVRRYGGGLTQKLQLVAGLIAKGFGTRIFYVSIDGFDTHANQAPAHAALLTELADAIGNFFETLKGTGDNERVRLMTFSEFGRRVKENGSRGTDHGAASCLFVAGPSVKGGVVGKHPSLSDLGDDDLKFHTDFRRVYATMLGSWLGCDSKAVLGAKWDHIPELEAKA